MKKDKLLQKAINSPQNLRFSEFRTLLESFGFYLDRSRGSHFSYCNDELRESIPVQDDNGYAKKYQVKQFLKILEENHVI